MVFGPRRTFSTGLGLAGVPPVMGAISAIPLNLAVSVTHWQFAEPATAESIPGTLNSVWAIRSKVTEGLAERAAHLASFRFNSLAVTFM